MTKKHEVILVAPEAKSCVYPMTFPFGVVDVVSVKAYEDFKSSEEGENDIILHKCNAICNGPICSTDKYTLEGTLERATTDPYSTSVTFQTQAQDIKVIAKSTNEDDNQPQLQLLSGVDKSILIRVKYGRTIGDLLSKMHATVFSLKAGDKCKYQLPKDYSVQDIYDVSVYNKGHE